MIPFIPPDLAPWIEFEPGTISLKENAPEEVRPIYEKLKADFEEGQKNMLEG